MKSIWQLAASALLLASATAAHAAEPIWDGNKVEMTSERLADGVYAFYAKDARQLNASGGAAATSSGLIVGTRGALLVDTMLNKRLNGQVQALVRAATRQPITFAVNTSSHGDHSYGNMYMLPSTRIVQAAHTKDYIAQHLPEDKSFMLKYFGEGRGIEAVAARPADIIVPAGGRISIDLGGKTVDIVDFGFAQTGGDLFVWEPASKVMWTGNPVIAGKPALPWLLDGKLLETLETLKRVYAFLPADARVVPGHGVVLSREDLRWHIDYLSEVKQRVQDAIDHGLTLDQTVQQVTMPDFTGYTLFGWVHSGLNVPAAYKDLRGK